MLSFLQGLLSVLEGGIKLPSAVLQLHELDKIMSNITSAQIIQSSFDICFAVTYLTTFSVPPNNFKVSTFPGVYVCTQPFLNLD